MQCITVMCILSMWYCKLVLWDASEACYVLPCYEGPGMQALWKLIKGVTFTGKSSGVFFVLHALMGVLLFRNRKRLDNNNNSDDDNFLKEAHFVIGIFIGCTLCAGVLSLNMIWVWGAERNLIHNLTKINPSNPAFDQDGRHMTVQESLIRTFTVLSFVSSIICFCKLLLVMLLLMARGFVSNYFRLLGGRSSEETVPLQSMSSGGDYH